MRNIRGRNNSNERKYVVIVLVVWAGIFLYLMKLDRDITELKRRDRG